MSWEAAASFAAPIIGGIFGSNSNKSAAKEAQLNREWQERMDNTKHQREVKDLIAAGLNPILSAHGSGSVPSGATAAQANPWAGLGEGINSAAKMSTIDKKRLEIEQQQTNANEAKLLAEENALNAEHDRKIEETNLLKENQELTRQNIQNAGTDNLIKSYTLQNVMPEQAKLLRAQSLAAISQAGASSAAANVDEQRANLLRLDVNKRSKSQEIEPEAEYLRVITNGVSNSAESVKDTAEAFWSFAPWKRGTKQQNRTRTTTKQHPNGQRSRTFEDVEFHE